MELDLMKENLNYFHHVQVADLDEASPELDTRKKNKKLA